MTHYSKLDEGLYAMALHNGVIVVSVTTTELCNTGDNIIVSERNVKGRYLTGNQFYGVITDVWNDGMINKEKCYSCQVTVMNNSHT